MANNKTNINNTTTNTINNSNKKNFAKNFVSHFVSPPLARLRPLAPARDSTPPQKGGGRAATNAWKRIGRAVVMSRTAHSTSKVAVRWGCASYKQ